MLEPECCMQRQRRLLAVMAQQSLDAIVIGATHHAYYFSGHWPFWQHLSAFILFSDGRTALIANATPTGVAADEVISYQAALMCTNRQEGATLIADLAVEALKKRNAKRVAIDASAVGAQLAGALGGQLSSIDPELWQLRRRKDPDELAIMRRAIECGRAMYERAREIIEPGIPELRVFAELNATAVQTAGEPLTALLGNDFACGVPGGPARADRLAQAGELYILDLGSAVRGYFSDTCRTFAVSAKPTDAQQKAYITVMGAMSLVESMARTGVRCREIFSAVDDYYLALTDKPFPHHLGHGVGLQPHEFPHLNPNWDDTLMEGEVFTCEPGLYGPHLAGGLRIENQYLVTKTGVENLTPFPTKMTRG